MPGVVLAGNRIPEIAIASWFGRSCSVCGKAPHAEGEGPPEQVSFTPPEKPLSDCTSSRNAAGIPRGTVSELGSAISLKDAAAVTVKLMLTGVAAR